MARHGCHGGLKVPGNRLTIGHDRNVDVDPLALQFGKQHVGSHQNQRVRRAADLRRVDMHEFCWRDIRLQSLLNVRQRRKIVRPRLPVKKCGHSLRKQRNHQVCVSDAPRGSKWNFLTDGIHKVNTVTANGHRPQANCPGTASLPGHHLLLKNAGALHNCLRDCAEAGRVFHADNAGPVCEQRASFTRRLIDVPRITQ